MSFWGGSSVNLSPFWLFLSAHPVSASSKASDLGVLGSHLLGRWRGRVTQMRMRVHTHTHAHQVILIQSPLSSFWILKHKSLKSWARLNYVHVKYTGQRFGLIQRVSRSCHSLLFKVIKWESFWERMVGVWSPSPFNFLPGNDSRGPEISISYTMTVKIIYAYYDRRISIPMKETYFAFRLYMVKKYKKSLN